MGEVAPSAGAVVDAHLEDLWLCCLDREPDVVQVTHVLSPSAECVSATLSVTLLHVSRRLKFIGGGLTKDETEKSRVDRETRERTTYFT